MKRVLLILVLMLQVGGAGEPQEALPQVARPDFTGATSCQVVRVVDGDTVVVKVKGEDRTVRLIGVDVPETVHPTKPVVPYGPEASRFLTNLLVGEEVYVARGPLGDRLDKYGRTLAYLYRAPDGLFVNLEIVRQGYGRVYTSLPFEHMAVFRAYERRAQAANKGLWGQPRLRAPVGQKREAATETVAPATKKAVAAPRRTPSTRPSRETRRSRPRPEPRSVTVYVTRTGKKYHVGSCRYLRQSKSAIRLDAARGQGYTPCKVCRPPG